MLATALLAGLGLVAPAGPLGAEPRATTGDASNDLMLHRFGSGAHRLMFSGETDGRAFPIFLTGSEARARAHIHITYTNAVSVMSEASRMRISVNDVVVSETPIASPAAEDPQTLDVDLPTSLLEPGYNAVKIEVQQRHRVDCSIAATYELWTQIDPASSGLTFDGLTPEPIGDLAELPALAPAADGTVALRLVVPKGIDASGLERLMRVAESVALRGHFTHPVVDVVGAPVEKPGLDIVVGTTDDLKAANLTDVLPEEDQLVALRAGQTPGHSILVLSGQSAADVDAAMASLLPAPGTDPSFGTPAGLKAVALMGGRPVEGGSVLNLRDLGVSSQEFSGRLFRAGFDLLMPPDFYAADYGKMTLLIDAGYASGLDKSSQILVRVNDRDAASRQLANSAGDVFRDRPITVPLSNLRPGFNHVEIEAELGNPADKSCDASVLMSGKKRFVLLDESTVELPSIARIAHMPSLSATAGSGFPYVGRVAEGEIDLPHPDADTVGAAATFLARAAVRGRRSTDAASRPVTQPVPQGIGHRVRGFRRRAPRAHRSRRPRPQRDAQRLDPRRSPLGRDRAVARWPGDRHQSGVRRIADRSRSLQRPRWIGALSQVVRGCFGWPVADRAHAAPGRDPSEVHGAEPGQPAALGPGGGPLSGRPRHQARRGTARGRRHAWRDRDAAARAFQRGSRRVHARPDGPLAVEPARRPDRGLGPALAPGSRWCRP